MIIYSIYKFVNKINGKCYIGFTKNVKKRLNEHRLSRDNTYFHNSIKKYGIENFSFEIIYQSKDGQHCKDVMESYFINLYDSFNSGYNLTHGGEGLLGFNHTETTKNKMRKPKSEIHIQNLKKSRNKREDRPMLGKKHSDETKQKMSETRKGIQNNKNKKQLLTPDGLFASVTEAGKFYGHNVYYMSRKIRKHPDKFSFI